MRRWVTWTVVAVILLAGCRSAAVPGTRAPAQDAPFPATWTPTTLIGETPTATRVVLPTPTWDGTPPPPSLNDVPRIPPARLDRALRGDTPTGLESGVTVVDVRSFAAYEQAHVPGARHIPLEELSERAGELDGNQTIVVYVLSYGESGAPEAAMALYELGFTRVAVLEGGIQRWYADGYAIEGTWLTPTPDEVGPPWALTPLATGTEAPVIEATATPRAGLESPDTPTPTVALTPTKQNP
jgi:rhodanese-related sulfurtransferase